MSVADAAVLATRNEGKLRELRPMFEAARLLVIDLAEAAVPETAAEDEIEGYATFEENALAKARYFARQTGRPAFADDSGLEVYALDGAPGVHSKRWSGRDDLSGRALDAENNAKLLRALADVEDRAARFVCAAAFVHGSAEIVRIGSVEGRILRAGRGSGGFGYDPLFELVELGSTFAEAGVAEKERVSHRGRAFRALLGDMRGRAEFGMGRVDRGGGAE